VPKSPWDGCQNEEVKLLRSPNELPPTSDGGEEHPVVGVTVYLATDRFAIGFQMASGKTLRVRLSSDQLAALGRVLLDLAEERRLHGDV
jgi:hypothetical protein